MRPDQIQRTAVTENLTEPASHVDEDRRHGFQAERPEAVDGDQQHDGPAQAGSLTTSATEFPIAGDQSQQFQTRWRDLQVAFVDEPRRAVQQADELVGEVLKSLEAHRRELGGRWHHDGQVQTEDLRLTLQEYRSLFDRLLRV